MKSIAISVQCFFYCFLLFFTNAAFSGESEYRKKIKRLCETLSTQEDQKQLFLDELKKEKNPPNSAMSLSTSSEGFVSLKTLKSVFTDKSLVQCIRKMEQELEETYSNPKVDISSQAGLQLIIHEKQPEVSDVFPCYEIFSKLAPPSYYPQDSHRKKIKVFCVFNDRGNNREFTVIDDLKVGRAIICFKVLPDLQTQQFNRTLMPAGDIDELHQKFTLDRDLETTTMAKMSIIEKVTLKDDKEFFKPEIVAEIVADNGCTDLVAIPWLEECEDYVPRAEKKTLLIDWNKLDETAKENLSPKLQHKARSASVRFVELDGTKFFFSNFMKFSFLLLQTIVPMIGTGQEFMSTLVDWLKNAEQESGFFLEDSHDFVDFIVVERPTKEKDSKEIPEVLVSQGSSNNITIQLKPVF
ncbi:hypothetical protein CI610_01617 [invertebrate metagenome]|uniref:Uncharacterized protein n=1 Tax=invertebrate metagenome TaxID=1711999 RepID=A0A2H9T883_9ZZZZ